MHSERDDERFGNAGSDPIHAHWGMCWLRDMVHRPLSHHEKDAGRSSVLSVSCGSGETV